MAVLSVILGVTVLLSFSTACNPRSPTGTSPHASRPNVVLIVADDMGFSDTGGYGGEIPTPHLDRLASEGLRFSQFYNSARCWPTRGALLTGYYAQQIRRDASPGGVGGVGGRRPEWAPLLSERLRPLGYRSYHSGKWHIDGGRLDGGFDHSYSVEDHDRYFAPRYHLEDDRPLPPVEPGKNAYVTTTIASRAIRYLNDHAANHTDQPFFLYLSFTSPHFPLQAPEDWIARYIERYRVGWEVIRQNRWQRLSQLGVVNHRLPSLELDVGPPYHFPESLKKLGPGEVDRPLPWADLTDEQRDFQATKMAIHAAMIEYMDHEIGRVLDQLRSTETLDETLIIFLSDNGASSELMVRGDGHDPTAPMGSAGSYLCLGPGWSTAANTPFRRHKTWVHEGGISTPLIVHWPNGITARGEWRSTPGHVIDVVPTILELAGGAGPESWEGSLAPPLPGRSLVQVFRRDSTEARAYLWWLHDGNRAIRVGDWKLVSDGKRGSWELYDLKSDRGESTNLIEQFSEQARELEELWTRKLAAFEEQATTSP